MERAHDSTNRKRDVQKSYVTILDQEIQEALDELERPPFGLFLSGLSAGLDIGFSVFVLAILVTEAREVLSEPVFEILRANAYSIGFILVIFGRSDLFTEHTTLAMLPVLDRSTSIARLGRLWGIVFLSNLIGAAVFAFLLSTIGPALGNVSTRAFGFLAAEAVGHSSAVILLSAILAGWLMGLVSWLVTAGRDTISEIFFVWLVTATIGLAHFHHCILGSVEMLAAIFAGEGVGYADYGRFLAFSTAGNVVGGVIFVALVKYGHATQVRRGMRHAEGIPERDGLE